MKIKYAVLAEWLRSLEAEGFVFGIDKRLQLQELIEKLPENSNIEQLKLQLSPALAQNEQEQDLVYVIFDRALKRVNAVHQSDLPTAEKKTKGKNLLWLPLAIILLALLSFLLGIFLSNPDVIEQESPPFTKFFSANPNVVDTICLDSIDLSKIEGLQLPIQGVVLCRNQNKSDASAFGKYQINKDLCLIYTALDSLGADSICIQLYDSKGDTLFAYFKPTIEQKNISTKDSSLAQTVAFTYEEYPLSTDIRSLEIEPLSYWERFYLDYEWLLKPLFYFLTALLLIFILLLRERNRRQLIAEIEPGDQSPNIWNIETAEKPNIELDRQFDTLLSSLRQRTTADQQILDLPKTIQSTIGKGGVIDFQYSFRTRPPEYLMLINQQNSDDHRAHWQDYLYHQFHENEVLIERFFYSDDPRLCWNETYTDGLQIKDLQQLYPESRLMLMSNGYSLLSPLTGKAAKWTTVFDLWKDRVVFSPIPSEEWGRKERLLAEHFVVLPDSLQALQFFVSQLELGAESEFSNWDNQVDDVPKYSIQIKPELGNIATQLTIHYDESLVRWIAACSVYPSLHWDLTMYLGDILSPDQENLLTTENITQLNRLPWFREGEIPDQVRSELLDWMEKEHPDTLSKVREGLHGLLQQNPPPSDSIAWEDYHVNASFNEWLITADNKRKKQLEREIAAEMEKGAEPDFTVVKYLNRPSSPLDFIVPDTWKKYVYNGGFSGLGFKGIGSDLFWAFPFWLAACILIWWLDPPISQQCSGDIVVADLSEVNGITSVSNVKRLEDFDKEVSETTYFEKMKAILIETLSLCIDEPSDRILLGEFLARFSIQVEQYERVDSITQTMLSIYENIDGTSYAESKRKADSLWTAYRRNLSVDYWNLAIPYFEQWDSLKQEELASEQLRQQTGIGEIGVLLNQQAAEAAQDTACFFFEKAWQLDSLNEKRLQAQAWCKDKIYDIRIYIASREQGDLADQLFTILKEKGYNISAITIDQNIQKSAVTYFFTEDEAIANSILADIQQNLNNETLVANYNVLNDQSPSQSEGNIRINLAADLNTSIIRTPPTLKPTEPLTITLYSYQQPTSEYQKVDQFLRVEGYKIFESIEMRTPLKNMANSPTIFYYSRARQQEAGNLANELEKITDQAFSIQFDTKLLGDGLDKEKSLVIQFVGKETTSLVPDRFPNIRNLLVKRITSGGNFVIKWIVPTTSKVETREDFFEVEISVLANQELLADNLWLVKNGEFLRSKVNENFDPSTGKSLRYIYNYTRKVELSKGRNDLQLAVIDENKNIVAESDIFTITKLDAPTQLSPISFNRPPIDLYFDYREPKSRDLSNYEELYEKYLRDQRSYVSRTTSKQKIINIDQLELEVNQFFEEEVKGNYELFQQLLDQISDYLQQGYEIQICLQATVDANGATTLNQRLVKRRIESIKKYMEAYKKGILKPFLNEGSLLIQELPVIGSGTPKELIPIVDPSGGVFKNPYDLTLVQGHKVSIVSIGTKEDNCNY